MRGHRQQHRVGHEALQSGQAQRLQAPRLVLEEVEEQVPERA
jgi:hypothetical protein